MLPSASFLFDRSVNKGPAYSVGGALLLEAAELELVLGSSVIPPPSKNMVTAISRLLLQASNICFPTLSVAPKNVVHSWCKSKMILSSIYIQFRDLVFTDHVLTV